jgi:hypothetical protein
VVRKNANLLHFQFAPSVSESSVGGVDLMGAKVAVQASVKNPIMSKGCFMAVLVFPVCEDSQHCFSAPSFDRGSMLSGVSFSLSLRAVKMVSSNGTNCFVVA